MPTTNQLSLLGEIEETKEEKMALIWRSINERKKTSFTYRGVRYIIYVLRVYNNELHYCRIAKVKKGKEYKEGEKDIIEMEGINLSYVNFVVHVPTQLVLVQKDTSAFADTSTPMNALKNYLTKLLIKEGYVVSIDEKPSNRKFWSYIDESNGIYSIQLKMNSLNLNLGDNDIRNAVRTINEDFNNEELEITLRNRQGKLNLAKEKIDGYFEYISVLGGKYRLVFKDKNNVKRAVTSLSNVISFKFLKDIKNEGATKIIKKLLNINDKPDE